MMMVGRPTHHSVVLGKLHADENPRRRGHRRRDGDHGPVRGGRRAAARLAALARAPNALAVRATDARPALAAFACGVGGHGGGWTI